MRWLPNVQAASLAPTSIDLADLRYYVPHYTPLDGLRASVRQVGVLNPPVVQRRGDSLVPVLGRRRIEAAIELGLPSIDVRIIPEAMLEQDGFALAFWDNLGCGRFAPATLAYVVGRLCDLFKREEMVQVFFPALDLPAYGPKIERLRKIGLLDAYLLEAYAAGRLQEKTMILMTALSPGDRRRIFDLVQEFGLNGSKAAEVTAAIVDLSVSTAASVEAVIHQAEVNIPIGAGPHERAEGLRMALLKMRCPELVADKELFESRLQELSPPPEVTARPYQSFEKPGCVIEYRASSMEEAERVIESLNTLETG